MICAPPASIFLRSASTCGRRSIIFRSSASCRPSEFLRYRRMGAGARLSRVRVRPAGALQLPRRAGAGRQQCRLARRHGRSAPRERSTSVRPTPSRVRVRWLGRVPYEPTWRAMQRFTDARDAATADELWLLEHDPVYTLGLNADAGACAGSGRDSGRAHRSRRAGDLPRSGSAGGLPAASTCAARISGCAISSPRSNAPSSSSPPAIGSPRCAASGRPACT